MSDDRGNPKYDQYPARVTLCFKNEEEKEYFMSQLSDGWGENYVSLNWPWKQNKKFKDVDMFVVEVFDDTGELDG